MLFGSIFFQVLAAKCLASLQRKFWVTLANAARSECSYKHFGDENGDCTWVQSYRDTQRYRVFLSQRRTCCIFVAAY